MQRGRSPRDVGQSAEPATLRRHFWSRARAELDGLPGNRGLNIAHEAVDRHAAGSNADRVALRCIAADGTCSDVTYREMRSLTNRFANVLQQNGVNAGDRVFTLLGRIPELYITALGTLKNRSVFCPMFAAFGPEPIHVRMRKGDARVLVTTEALYERKIAPIRNALSKLEIVLLVGDGTHGSGAPDSLDFDAELSNVSDGFTISATDPNDLALLHFTSGTTGTPKGAMHVHEAVVAHHATAAAALDLNATDIFWCTADPGWVTGTSYGIVAPLTRGATLVIDAGEFDAHRWYRTLHDQGVTVWYTAPTAIRMLMRAGGDVSGGLCPPELRFIASVGEALSPDAVRWSVETFGRPIHDNWWQTETGCIMIANGADMAIKPGSMGKPLPGIEACLVERRRGGDVTVIDSAGTVGELAFEPGWPSMFRGYIGEEARYKECFSGGRYLSGDLARRDDDGYYWFVGRADDVIKSSGHLIGPVEVEAALLEHPAVAEVGVIGMPDELTGERVKAFVALKAGAAPSDDLGQELRGFARQRLGAAVAPKEIDFIARIPKTRSGKIMRRLLKARALGLPEGDLSTLDEDTKPLGPEEREDHAER